VKLHPGKTAPELGPQLTELPSWWKDHFAYVTQNGYADFEQASLVTGQKFCYLKKELALLELAIQHWAIGKVLSYRSHLDQHTFECISTPDLVAPQIAQACGFQVMQSLSNSLLCGNINHF
jgi:seryl-tRNA synthetase